MTSLNRRVIYAVVGVTSLVVLVASLALWFFMQSLLMRGVDRELTSRIERIKNYEPLGSPEFWRTAMNDGRRRWFIDRITSGDWRTLIQVIDVRDGAELHRSNTLTVGLDLAPLSITPVAIEAPVSYHLDDGSRVRLLAFPMMYHLRSNSGDSRRDGREVSRTTENVRATGTVAGMLHSALRTDKPTNAAPASNNATATQTSRTTGAATVVLPSASPTDKPTNAAPASENPTAAVTKPTLTTTNTTGTTVITILPSNAAHPPEAPHQGVMIYLALGLEQADGELSRMAMVLGVLWAAATLLAFGTILLLRPAVLKPTRDLAAAIARLGPDDLAARVPIKEAPHEMRVVVDCLNGLFDRLEQAFKREQATIANIAHELRTPVAELRTALEFRQMTATGADRTELDALLATVMRMQTQVTNLLLLARLEAGKEPLQRSDADLGELVSEAAERWEDRASARSLDLSLGTFARVPVSTSPDHLGLVLDNLFSNAVAHATAEGIISVEVFATDTEVTVSISNPFTGTLDLQQLSHAYYRGDDARHGGDHSGLGLALCQRLCRLLDARLELAHAEGQFRASVVLKRRS